MKNFSNEVNSQNIKEARKKCKRYEKKYGLKPNYIFEKDDGVYELYANAANHYIPYEEKKDWTKAHEMCIQYSKSYRIHVQILNFIDLLLYF